MINFFDTHCHLHYMQNPQEAIERSHTAGVKALMCVSTSMGCPEQIIKIIAENKTPIKIYFSAGIHPKDVKNYTLEQIDTYLKQWCTKVQAIGETGLDDFTPISNEELAMQIKSFELHMQYAEKYNLPIIMHLRCGEKSNLEETVKRLITCKSGIAHCFGGSYELIQFLVNKGWYISFAGNITYGALLHQAVKCVPSEKLLIETDSPFLPPEPYRKEKRGKNDPSYIKYTFDVMCDIRKIKDKTNFSKALYLNSCKVFGLDSDL